MNSVNYLSYRRRSRLRAKIRRHAKGRVRLSVFRSHRHIYAQLIDDGKGETIASASSLDNRKDPKQKYGQNVSSADEVGKLIALKGREAGVEEVVFDRGGYLYHGRIKALAEAAREAGLAF